MCDENRGVTAGPDEIPGAELEPPESLRCRVCRCHPCPIVLRRAYSLDCCPRNPRASSVLYRCRYSPGGASSTQSHHPVRRYNYRASSPASIPIHCQPYRRARRVRTKAPDCRRGDPLIIRPAAFVSPVGMFGTGRISPKIQAVAAGPGGIRPFRFSWQAVHLVSLICKIAFHASN